MVLSMDVSIQCCHLVSEDITGSSGLMKSCITSKKCTGATHDNSVTELGNAFSEILSMSDVQVSSCVPALESRQVCHQHTKELFDALEIHHTEPLVPFSDRRLSKCATFPCSGKILFSLEPTNKNNVTIPCTAAHTQNSVECGNLACSRSTSLPSPLKLVPAIKGSRVKQGAPPKKLSVTWAEDVYDPPATSLSHTVRSHHQQRPKAQKKGKQKNKAKSSRGSNNSKKQYRKYVGSSDMRSKSVATADRLLFDDPDSELVDFAVSGQDSKCGSSFLKTSLTKVHMPLAEAK